MARQLPTQVGDSHATHVRLFPIGAEVLAEEGVHFRVWAPGHKRIEVVLDDDPAHGYVLTDEKNGYYSGLVSEAHTGSLYRYRIDNAPNAYPDPASRWQPAGPHGSSCVVDPSAFMWTDSKWNGPGDHGRVIYELHLGTFTRQGTVRAAMDQLKELSSLGITVIELMPIADFPGLFGWGYDGVNLFAPTRLYGEPDDYKKFIDTAHALGLAVILDVVYNHFGPDGNFLRAYSTDYFTHKYENEWGEAVNFDGPHSAAVRELYVSNAVYWITEYHFDGFRFDATHRIFDASSTHILAEIAQHVRFAAGTKQVLLIAEDDSLNVQHIRRQTEGGFGFDCIWNDDLHHSLMVRLTGHREAYYADYRGTVQELLSALKWGFLYQGQSSASLKQRRGTPTYEFAPSCFVTYLQNHDQVSNSSLGLRIHAIAAPDLLRAATALWLLTPGTPMFFQGQEFAAHAPFPYFADHSGELGSLVSTGRKKFLSQFPSLASAEMQARLSDPADRTVFERCKLNLAERRLNAAVYHLHRDLLWLRKNDAVLRALRPGRMDGAVLNDDAFVLRFFADNGADRLLLVNFGRDVNPEIMPEPLLAPPLHMRWHIAWSSEDPKYDGGGVVECESPDGRWCIQGHAAAFLIPQQRQ
jgi:maltooligosyltrehalose trehalohydrolase